jgi:hypothetical protein
LKKDDGTSEDYVKVDTLTPTSGTLRSNSAIEAPESATLLIRSQVIGQKGSRAQRHSQTIDRTVSDVNGALVRGSATLSVVFPDNIAFTTQMVIDMLHQLMDLYISTSTFDVDDAVVKSILRNES